MTYAARRKSYESTAELRSFSNYEPHSKWKAKYGDFVIRETGRNDPVQNHTPGTGIQLLIFILLAVYFLVFRPPPVFELISSGLGSSRWAGEL